MTANAHSWIADIASAFARGDSVRRVLPGGGELVLERALPFLVVHRALGDGDDETPRLARAEASHLLWPADPLRAHELRALVRAVVEAGVKHHGSFLLVELWRGEARAFRVRAPEEEAPATVRALAQQLNQLWHLDRSISVEILPSERRAPPGEEPLLTVPECYRLGALMLGVEVPPVYLQPGGAVFPLFFRRFREGMSRALRCTAFEFARVQTEARFEAWQAFGPREVDPLVREADRVLAEIGAAFDFPLLVSPVNQAEAWQRFRESGFAQPPEFRYRLLPMDPDVLKRRLFAIELEKVDDPALVFLLRDRRDDLDRRLSMLAERGTPDFLYGSIRLYHPVGEENLTTARRLLTTLPPSVPAADVAAVDASGFAAAAEEEFAAYRQLYPGFAARAQIRPDVSGIMVSEGNLLIGDPLRLDPARVDAVLQHEVGTHLLTWHNGAAQPLHLLGRGLAGHEELQEGLAALAEYLAGGMSAARLRNFAARVVAARTVEAGADFLETFRTLRDPFALAPAEAFAMAARVHRSGGFTRDAVYLRGIARLLDHLRRGGELEALYSGKICLRQLDAVLDLRDRGILRPPAILPLVLRRPDAARRLDAARRGLELADLARDDAGA